ncbi:hypothetical protein MTR_2g018430 [Medicago truncatula]|uniref:FAS1 domain-containing protein n=1 Tax=Medicago truncatula TaxID=3880 RepID=G7ILX4_MEDTR|nr:hypothetical protein MTR_2g018430 [Medicago truncatula]
MFQIVLIVTIILSSSSLSSLNLSSPITSSSSSSSSSSFFNLTKILYSSHTFFKAASEFHSLGIDSEIDTRYPTTVFVSDNKAFVDATVSKRYKSLSDNNKYFVLKCHVSREYFVIVAKRVISFGNRSICECFVIRNKYRGWITSVNITVNAERMKLRGCFKESVRGVKNFG